MCTRVLQNGVQRVDSPEQLLPLIVGAALGRHALRHTDLGQTCNFLWSWSQEFLVSWEGTDPRGFHKPAGQSPGLPPERGIIEWYPFRPQSSQNIKYFVVQMQWGQ